MTKITLVYAIKTWAKKWISVETVSKPVGMFITALSILCNYEICYGLIFFWGIVIVAVFHASEQQQKMYCLQTLNIVDIFHLCINIIYVMLWAGMVA